MAKRKWLFGCLCLTIGILVGHVVTRAAMSSARSTTLELVGIPRASSEPQGPTQKVRNVHLTDVAFCHRISSFGNYEKYDRDEFTLGQEVLVYGEIGNFRSEQIPDGRFRTLLNSKVEFYRDGELPEAAKPIELPETEDLCRQPRHDYFHSYQLVIPEALTAGRYILRLTIHDQLGQSEASRSLTFVVR